MEEVKTVTKPRRGVGTARGTQRLKFSHEHAKTNGLFIAHLDSVKVKMITIGENTSGMPSFNGYEIPRLDITFASNEAADTDRKYVTLSFNAIESNVETIPGGAKEWRINTIFDWMKHILNVYVLKGRELTEKEADALSLAFDDTDEEGNYKAVAVEDVIAAYKTLFENFVAMMDTAKDGKPAYLDKDGKFIPVWIKLIRYIKTKQHKWTAVNGGELSFPTFVGEGCVEIFRQNVAPVIRINSINETILPREDKEETKAPNLPGIGGMMPGAIPGVFGTQADIMAETATDTPF